MKYKLLIVYKNKTWAPSVEYADTIEEAAYFKQRQLFLNSDIEKILIGPYHDVEIGPPVKK